MDKKAFVVERRERAQAGRPVRRRSPAILAPAVPVAAPATLAASAAAVPNDQGTVADGAGPVGIGEGKLHPPRSPGSSPAFDSASLCSVLVYRGVVLRLDGSTPSTSVSGVGMFM